MFAMILHGNSQMREREKRSWDQGIPPSHALSTAPLLQEVNISQKARDLYRDISHTPQIWTQPLLVRHMISTRSCRHKTTI